jgi:peptide/nickel transport system substrate-binding protein
LRWLAGGKRKPVHSAILIGVALAAGVAETVYGATEPQYGGTLVVEVHAAPLVLDPAKWKMGAPEYAASVQIASAVFDRLVTLDRFGRFQPALATEWSHDAAWRRWQFTLRPGVEFSDGSLLTSAEVAAALQELLPDKPMVTGAGTRVVVQFPSAVPDLLEQLASQRYFIYRRASDNALLGTGAFFVKEFIPASSGATVAHYKLAANEHCWAGRPFVDLLEVNAGVPMLRQLFDLQLGKADVVELSPDLVRRATQENLHVWASAPMLLYALRISSETGGPGKSAAARSAAAKMGIGEALSQAMDRGTMANVLLQRQAETAASFLPQWLSGYAFVFGSAFDGESRVPRAKETSSARFAGANEQGATPVSPLRLRVDASGDLAKLIAERVAINARQAGITVQVQPHSTGRDSSSANGAGTGKTADASGLRLVAWRYSSLSERAELDAMVSELQLEPTADEKTAADAEQSYGSQYGPYGHVYGRTYGHEKRLLEKRELIPLVVMPEYVGLSAGVRDWTAERWGEWHLADVWLDGKRPVASPAAPAAGAQH